MPERSRGEGIRAHLLLIFYWLCFFNNSQLINFAQVFLYNDAKISNSLSHAMLTTPSLVERSFLFSIPSLMFLILLRDSEISLQRNWLTLFCTLTSLCNLLKFLRSVLYALNQWWSVTKQHARFSQRREGNGSTAICYGVIWLTNILFLYHITMYRGSVPWISYRV